MLEIVCLQVRAPHNSGYCLQVFSSREQQEQSMHLKYVEILAIGFHENMKLGDKTPE